MFMFGDVVPNGYGDFIVEEYFGNGLKVSEVRVDNMEDKLLAAVDIFIVFKELNFRGFNRVEQVD